MTAISDELTRLYDTLFNRAPDADGLRFWTDARAAGTPLATVADLLTRTSEFQAAHGTPDDGQFVGLLYRNALGRAPDGEGLAFWTNSLQQQAATRSGVALAVSESAEHVSHMQTAGVAASSAASAPPGYRVVLADDFSRGYLKEHWGDPFPLPWPPGPSANGAYIWDPNEVNVRDGEMQVTMRRHDDGHWSTTGFSSFKAGIGITYGRVEFDAKVESGKGTVGGILMWPSDDTFPPEIDILETPENTGLFTLHWGKGDGGSWPIRDTSFDPSQWHHYTMEWLPSGITIWADGQVKAQWTDNIPNIKMSFGALGFVGSPYDSWMGGAPDSTTPPLVTLHLDNVVMSQWVGIA